MSCPSPESSGDAPASTSHSSRCLPSTSHILFREDEVTSIAVKSKRLLREARVEGLPYLIDKFALRSRLENRIPMSVRSGGGDYIVL